MRLASLHANRLVEKLPVGRNIGTQNREAGWEKVLRTKSQGVRMGWLVDYFIQATDFFFFFFFD